MQRHPTLFPIEFHDVTRKEFGSNDSIHATAIRRTDVA